MKRILAFTLITFGLFLTGFVFYRNSGANDVTRTFSPYTLLSSSWEKYKTEYINEDGRVIDYSLDGITTSEGQSYALLRSVWMDDKTTFDSVWKWTKENLKRPNDNLFGWRWGETNENTYGFSGAGGDNSASDADSDIALALILAGNRWNDTIYKEEAKLILEDLWNSNTATAQGERYLIAGNWASGSSELVLNPSYFAPYAWRMFAEVDRENDWESLIDPAYTLLEKVGREPLDKEKGVGLPPDWVSINRETGELKQVAQAPNFTTNYSYDAIRVPWRIALDFEWYGDERARTYLTNSFKVLEEKLTTEGKLYDSYSHDGQALTQIEGPSMYATFLGYLLIANPDLAEKIYNEKIINLYSNDVNTFNEDLQYYEQNWLWFGAALYHKQLGKYQ